MIIENNMKIKTRGIQVNFDEYILNVKIPLMIVIGREIIIKDEYFINNWYSSKKVKSFKFIR